MLQAYNTHIYMIYIKLDIYSKIVIQYKCIEASISRTLDEVKAMNITRTTYIM